MNYRWILSIIFLLVLCLFPLCLLSCTEHKENETKVLAKINNYDLGLDEFLLMLSEELEMEDDFKLTEEAKVEFLEELIRKELLLQEAKKLKLDRKDKFMRAIERYWESTLIRDLIDIKSREISKKTVVSQKEIELYYTERKEADASIPPLSDVENEIGKMLKEKKKSEMLKAWISGLRDTADIKIDKQLLTGSGEKP